MSDFFIDGAVRLNWQVGMDPRYSIVNPNPSRSFAALEGVPDKLVADARAKGLRIIE
jgi:hypothetical protein